MLLTAVVGLWCAAFGVTLAALLDHWASEEPQRAVKPDGWEATFRKPAEWSRQNLPKKNR